MHHSALRFKGQVIIWDWQLQDIVYIILGIFKNTG